MTNIKKISTLFFLFSLLLLVSCASSGSLAELQKYSGTFDKHKVVHLQLIPNPTLKRDRDLRAKFEIILSRNIAKLDLFDEIVTVKDKKASLIVSAKFVQIDEPSDLASVFASSYANSEVKLVSTIFENGTVIKQIASLDVTGNSKNRGRATIGGIGITEGEELTDTALNEAAIRIANYIRQHSRKKKE